jgi:hypothetical protein
MRRTRRAHLFAALSGIVGAAGCTLIVDTSDLAGAPASPDLPDDAAVEANIVKGDDAAVEVDARDASVDARGIGCAAVLDASFCEDFERTDSLSTTVWTAVDTNDGVISLTDAASVSPPTAASFHVSSDAGNCRYVRVSRRFPGAFSRASTRFSVFATSSAYVFSFTASSSLASTSYQAIFRVEASASVSLRLQKASGGAVTDLAVTSVPLATSAQGRWLTVEAMFGEASGTLSIVADGFKGADISLPSDFVLKDPAVSFGPFCAPGSSDVLFDDVSVIVTP